MDDSQAQAQAEQAPEPVSKFCTTAPSHLFYIFCDGGCLRQGTMNPFIYGSYYIYDLTDLKGTEIGIPQDLIGREPKIKDEKFPLTGGMTTSSRVQIRSTNNTAEALSLMTCLARLQHDGLMVPQNELRIYMDSELVLNQIQGIYATRDPGLLHIHRMSYDILNGYQKKFRLRTLSPYLTLHKVSGDDMKILLGH